MHTFNGERTCAVNISTYLPEDFGVITHNIVAQMLAEEEYLEETHRIQISTCHTFIFIFFNTIDILLTFCETEHEILPNIHIQFEPDYHDKIRISIENIPIELPDKEVKTFLSQYAKPVGKTYYPGQKFQNKFYTTETRVYHCINMIEHLPKHIHKFGRYLRICYDSQPNSPTITDGNNKTQDTLAPEKQLTPQKQHQLQKNTHIQQASEDEYQTSEDEQQTIPDTKSSDEQSEDEQQSTLETQYIAETQQEIQQQTPRHQIPNLPEKTPTPNITETPTLEKLSTTIYNYYKKKKTKYRTSKTT